MNRVGIEYETHLELIFTWICKLSKLHLLSVVLVLALAHCSGKSNDIPFTPDTSVVEITPAGGMDLYGFIGDSGGTPIKNVVVSDGFDCTTTDAKGIYQMKRNANSRFVFYSTPAEYAVNTTSETAKMASFYAPLITTKKRYDFALKKLSVVETNFTLLCIGDPQVTSADDVNRFRTETMSDIKAFTESESTPCYGLGMGDMVGDKPAFFDQMKGLIGSANMTVFTTIGNHDKVATSIVNQPRTTDDFSKVYGPLNYSFNRGDVHFICLDNVIFSNSSDYTGGFTSSQVEWLKQDLSYVSKDKMVVLYYHIPIRGTSNIANRAQILSALQGFAEVHLMCGHTHYTENYPQTSPITAYEHVHAAACGSWWRSTLNGDGTPNGYAVYSVSGNRMTNWYYKPTKLSKDFQIRLHNGNVSYGGAFGYYNFNQGDNTIVANVWNSDSKWKIEAYEDGIKVGNLTPLSASLKDAWTLGYHIGILNRNPDNYSPASKHLYLHKRVNPSANLEIRATDGFGNVYKQNQIIADFVTAASY